MNGHPLKTVLGRAAEVGQKLLCKECGVARKGIKSCDLCNFDLCQDCINDNSDKMFQAPVQANIKAAFWEG